ncbi:MAG TPA: FHA domain-containing protein [Gammaproteobacteria bacterium]|nr:FHA domain-containing protein [Gammaproteobacteria bacterium]
MSKLTLSFKGRVLKIFPVLQGEMHIGSDPSCTLHIDSLALAPRHARIDTRGTETTLVDLGSEDGTFVNNTRIEQHVLKDGDMIRVGKHTLLYTYDEVIEEAPLPEPQVEEVSPAEAEALTSGMHSGLHSGLHKAQTGWLQILTGQNLGQTVSLNRSVTNLGKPGVATAVIARRADGYFITHLEGPVPPTVNDQAIGSDPHKLDQDDIIQIGNIKMQFYYE